MKNILFALVGVLLGFLLCYFLKPESDNSKQLPFLSDKEMEEKQMIIDELKEAYMTKDYDSTDGIFIRKSDRTKKINAFKAWKNKVGNVDQTIITDHFFIGKDKLYQLVNEMKLENSRNSGKDKIGGLIIELGITDKTTYRDSNGNPTRVINGNRLEIMIFPTKVNKGSIMRDKSSESDSLMVQGGPTLLDDTMPCPDNCN